MECHSGSGKLPKGLMQYFDIALHLNNCYVLQESLSEIFQLESVNNCEHNPLLTNSKCVDIDEYIICFNSLQQIQVRDIGL